MNNRIQQIANEAKIGGADFDNGAKFYVGNEETFTKFAEMLVQECVQTLVNHGYTDAADCLEKEQMTQMLNWQKYQFPEI